MTWSSGGTSIILPSDHVDGDGRNYIVIGEDVPTAIASDFTAAIVFHNGANPDAPMFGFDWFAIGFSVSGRLELIGYFYQWSASPAVGGQEQFYRQSFLSIAPPVGVDKPARLFLGAGVYGERGSTVAIGDGFNQITENGVDLNAGATHVLIAAATGFAEFSLTRSPLLVWRIGKTAFLTAFLTATVAAGTIPTGDHSIVNLGSAWQPANGYEASGTLIINGVSAGRVDITPDTAATVIASMTQTLTNGQWMMLNATWPLAS